MMNNDDHSTTIYINTEPVYLNQQQLNKSIESDELLYENSSVIDNLNKQQQNSDNDSINTSPKIPRIPPPIKPRLSLLNKKLQQLDNRSSYEIKLNKKLEQIDENLNLILKEHKDKYKDSDLILNKNLSLEQSEKDLYLSNDTLPSNNLFKEEDKKMNELDRNTYISHSDVNYDLNNRLSNNYNELDEPIYSDIIFESKRNSNVDSYYDTLVPFENDNISDYKTVNLDHEEDSNYLKPPPLPPRRKSDDELNNKIDNIKNNLENELKIHFLKDNNFKEKFHNYYNSSNNAPINQFNTLTNEHLKLNEIKENLNLMRKDHFLSLNHKNKFTNKDEFESNNNNLSKIKPQLVVSNNTDGYGKINKITESTHKDTSDDDEGSLKSSFSFMDSQLNSSSNDTFSYKSAKSNNSNKSIITKPNIGIIAPFSIRNTSPSSSSTNDQDTIKKDLNKVLTVRLNDELKTTFNMKESPIFHKKLNSDIKKDDRNQLYFNPDEFNQKNNKFYDSENDLNKFPKQEFINTFNLNQQKLEATGNQETNQNNNEQFSTDNQSLNNIREYLYKTGSNRKQFHKRWCVLSESALFYYLSDLAEENITELKNQKARGHIELNDILFISLIPDLICLATNKFIKAIKSIKKIQNVELYQFNVGINSENGRLFLLATDNGNKRQLWIDLLAHRIKPKLKPSSIIYREIDACGYLNIKIGLTGLWTKAWLVLKKRELNILILDIQNSDEDLIKIDLRKVMTIGYNQNQTIESCEHAFENGPIFYLNRRYETVLYFQADYKLHTEEWFQSVKHNWILPDNGLFEDQLLAPNSIPISVEKCLNFISSYNGISTKLIYKSSGDDSYTKCILENLKSNFVFDYHIRPEDGFTVADVADALKIYLKSFPECILTEKLYQDFLRLNFCSEFNERLTKLKLLLKRLPIVNYNTLKKLICHFTLIVENKEENEMTLDNLAYAICPYLIFSKISAPQSINLSVNLFKDLVNSYIWLFDLNPEELDKERKIENSLKELRRLHVKQQKDELLVGVYLFNRDWDKCINVPINSTMSADDLLFYICKVANLKESPTKLCVCECVSNDQLERVIHYSERIKQITLAWNLNWSQTDAKDNYLLIKCNSLYEELDDYFDKGIDALPSLFSEVKFSEEGKNFKKVFLEFTNSKFNVFKDAKATKSLVSWCLEDVTWYLGCEKKRNSPTRFCITLINKDEAIQRQKDLILSKVISFNTEEELSRWLAAIICCEHPEGVHPLIHGINTWNSLS